MFQSYVNRKNPSFIIRWNDWKERKHEGNSWIILWMPSFLREWWVPFVIRQRNGCDSLLIITLSVCREVAFIIHSCLCRGTPPLGTTDATRSGREEGGTESPRLSVPRRFQLENVIKIQIIIYWNSFVTADKKEVNTKETKEFQSDLMLILENVRRDKVL